MKKPLLPATVKVCCIALFICFSLFSRKASAQCNVNERYDNIISGYHSSIALKDSGNFAVWGSSMLQTGAADAYSPQNIDSAHYTGLTKSTIIYKAAIGGKSAGTDVDQAILLTSTGIWAWGIVGNVLKSTVKSTAVFGRITSPTGGFGSTTLGLPTGVNPSDVQSMFATYQTLILLTKIVGGSGGNVYVLTQASLAVEANGGAVATAGSSSWQKVKTDANTYLSGVTAVRGQVYNASNNAFVALTSGGQVYTWGNTTYLGSGAVAARNYATAMTLPMENGLNIVPKIIGVTGGGASGATVKNTYYVLSATGNLYALGDNSQKQCGDFTTTERQNWVRVKKSSAANDYLTNINFISCQEHCASYPGIAAITNSGELYTWGNNSSGMLARSDNGQVGGNLTTTTYDPGLTAGISGAVVSVEMGGHTLVYLKEGNAQFCYAGHYTNGSMGDGGTGDNGSSSASALLLNCSSTPNISICGYVPVAASTTQSQITLSPSSIVANGTSTTTITITLKTSGGALLGKSGGIVLISTTAGTIGTVIDNNDGTYTAILTSSATAGNATLSFSINGSSASATAIATFTSLLPVLWSDLGAKRKSKDVSVEWETSYEQNVANFIVQRSSNGVDWNNQSENILPSNTAGKHRYQYTDNKFSSGYLFYRIIATDADGKFSYSKVLSVLPVQETDKVILFPIPVISSFSLGNIVPEQLRQVQLYNMNGVLLNTWNGYREKFEVSTLASGNYTVKLVAVDGTVQAIQLRKQ
jgi:alpha-tubulin suppressor-like RCC1 family protein